MRAPLPFVIITALALTPVANAQTAAVTQSAATRPAVAKRAATERAAAAADAAEPAVTQPAFAPPVASQPAAQPTAVPAHTRVTAHVPRPSHSRQSPSRRTTGAAQASAPAGKPDGVLDLGATDITGNKELPKVMVIVPWKDSLGAGGVIKPSDSLLDEMLQPVDRGVFQRRIRYYGQLEPTAVAPAGDSH